MISRKQGAITHEVLIVQGHSKVQGTNCTPRDNHMVTGKTGLGIRTKREYGSKKTGPVQGITAI
jgi:hypothetical protein